MGKYEVTQGEYLEVMGNNQSAFTEDTSRPVEPVSWNDAVAYCAALTERERQAGRIAPNAQQCIPPGRVHPQCVRTLASLGLSDTLLGVRRHLAHEAFHVH